MSSAGDPLEADAKEWAAQLGEDAEYLEEYDCDASPYPRHYIGIFTTIAMPTRAS